MAKKVILFFSPMGVMVGVVDLIMAFHRMFNGGEYAGYMALGLIFLVTCGLAFNYALSKPL